MSIKYKFPVLQRLKEAGYNTNRIRKEKLFSESTLQKFRRGEYISFDNVNTLCRLLHIQPGDLLEFREDEEED